MKFNKPRFLSLVKKAKEQEMEFQNPINKEFLELLRCNALLSPQSFWIDGKNYQTLLTSFVQKKNRSR
jgi:hypothetical protein